MISKTLMRLRKARVTIPRLSPSHTKARIYKWCVDIHSPTPLDVESYDPLFVLECSPDLVTSGFRVHEDHKPLMIVEAHDEGRLRFIDGLDTDTWYNVGDELGEIDDSDDDDDNSEWLWQAYSYDEPQKGET